jgi:hypothetical protein
MFLHDSRVIQRTAQFEVQAQRYEVMFKDGSAMQLHPVCHAATPTVPDTFLRAVHCDGLVWVVFDLAKVGGRELETDIRSHLPRDTPGLVFYSLRAQFPNTRAFTNAMQAQRVAQWWDSEQAAA